MTGNSQFYKTKGESKSSKEECKKNTKIIVKWQSILNKKSKTKNKEVDIEDKMYKLCIGKAIEMKNYTELKKQERCKRSSWKRRGKRNSCKSLPESNISKINKS